jgi:hypothetical protein
MSDKNQHLQDLKDIRSMMERSSRFISLSGWSGVAAGLCALAGGFFGLRQLAAYGYFDREESYEFFAFRRYSSSEGWNLNKSIGWNDFDQTPSSFFKGLISDSLFHILLVTFLAAFALAFLFTWVKSKKQGIPIWGVASKRLMWSVVIPMVAGGIFLYKMAEMGNYGLLAPGMLVFYGLALLNASKHTLPEIKYLGYAQLLLGIINCWAIGYGLYFWMLGFGVLHIVYGFWMWRKYERQI